MAMHGAQLHVASWAGLQDAAEQQSYNLLRGHISQRAVMFLEAMTLHL